MLRQRLRQVVLHHQRQESSDRDRLELKTSSRNLIDLIEVLPTDQVITEPCTICLENFIHDTQSPTADHLAVRPKVCEDHIFHLHCLRSWLRSNASCPLCRTQLVILTGNQPETGTSFTVTEEPYRLPGHEDTTTLRIDFHFEPGLQTEHHPLPHEAYQGCHFTTYLPHSSEGQEVLRLLRLAWNRKLLFRIGLNPTTQRMNLVTLNGLELKSSKTMFPDQSYLSRLKADLREIGVK